MSTLPPGSAPWTLDLKTAAVWGVFAEASTAAVMPYLMRLTPQAAALASALTP